MKTKTDIVKNWIENYIMDLNLCPFSHASFENDALEYLEVKYLNEKFIKETFNDFLSSESSMQHSLLLIFGDELSWEELLEVESLFDFFISEAQSERIKFVLFHPEYKHGETENQLLHYTNRSPLPIIQLLHLDFLTSSVSEGAVSKILFDNEQTLMSKSLQELNIKLDGFK